MECLAWAGSIELWAARVGVDVASGKVDAASVMHSVEGTCVSCSASLSRP